MWRGSFLSFSNQNYFTSDGNMIRSLLKYFQYSKVADSRKGLSKSLSKMRKLYGWSSVSTLSISFARSSRSDMFYKIRVFKHFAKFTGEHLYRCLFFKKVACLQSGTLSKNTPEQLFSGEFCEMFKNSYFVEHLRTAASDIRNVKKGTRISPPWDKTGNC